MKIVSGTAEVVTREHPVSRIDKYKTTIFDQLIFSTWAPISYRRLRVFLYSGKSFSKYNRICTIVFTLQNYDICMFIGGDSPKVGE